jgi:hypothetical protein
MRTLLSQGVFFFEVLTLSPTNYFIVTITFRCAQGPLGPVICPSD